MTEKNKTLSLVEQAAALLGEQVTTGGGATGSTKGPTPVAAAGGGAHGNRPQDKNQGDPMNRGQNPAGIPIEATSTENNTAPTGDNSASNRASVAMKSVREDVDAMFVGHEVSEDFKVKATTIFEAAVAARVALVEEALEEAQGAQLEEAVELVKEDLTNKLNEYLEYVVEQWMEDNAIAIEGGLRADISESFMAGLHELFSEHYINVPEEEIDVAAEMAAHIDTLETQVNDVVNENIELKKIVEAAARAKIVEGVTEGLVETQKAKLETLFEGVEFTTAEEFTNKLKTIKEGYVGTKSSKAAGIQNLLEQVTEVEDTKPADQITEPQIKSYVDALSRTARPK